VTSNPWIGFALRRAVGFVVGALLLIVVSFAMIHLVPGDPVRASLGLDVQAETIDLKRHELHLDEPILTQFMDYVRGLAGLDFGTSIKTDEPVVKILSDRLPNTAELAVFAILLVIVTSIPIGLIAGARTYGRERAWRGFAFTAVTGTVTAIPQYLMAVLLIVAFSLTLNLLPSAGKDQFNTFILPACALALGPAAYLARVVRIETINVLGREYVMTARSKQLPTHILYLRHVLPNVLTAALTLVGVLFGSLIAGSVIIEDIFAWPGIGTVLIGAILDKDYPVVQSTILVLGLLVLTVNTAVDILLVLLNPRFVSLQDS
jgi:peptide/nickel transport system permease protein